MVSGSQRHIYVAQFHKEEVAMTSNRLKVYRFIETLHDLWTWKTAERNLLIDWHKFLNGDHPYVPCNFPNASQFGNPRSNEAILASIRKQFEDKDETKVSLGRIRWFLNDGSNNFHFAADVTCARLIPGSKCEWLLMLDGTLKRLGFEEGETPAKMACYYDTSRGEGFALMPNLAREQLHSFRVK